MRRKQTASQSPSRRGGLELDQAQSIQMGSLGFDCGSLRRPFRSDPSSMRPSNAWTGTGAIQKSQRRWRIPHSSLPRVVPRACRPSSRSRRNSAGLGGGFPRVQNAAESKPRRKKLRLQVDQFCAARSFNRIGAVVSTLTWATTKAFSWEPLQPGSSSLFAIHPG
jgi:hypothetical protein